MDIKNTKQVHSIKCLLVFIMRTLIVETIHPVTFKVPTLFHVTLVGSKNLESMV